jgi:ABC-2 type transport system ATP-binding protein
MVAIQVKGANEQEVRQKLEQVSGVAKVTGRDAPAGMVAFEIESMEQYAVRPDLARAVVQSGWDLTELRTVGESLEEIFLELTKSEAKPAAIKTAATHTGEPTQ